MFIRRLGRDTDGNVLVEFTVMMTLIFVLLLGGVDFLFAFYQWNTAVKAVELGARIAAVSDPVASGLNGLSAAVASSTGTVGGAMPSFTVTCNGATVTCTCTGTCTGVSGYSSTAMNTILYGRGNAACNAGSSINTVYYTGMCGIFPTITAANVVIVYTQTGLGYVGRPSGPVPTITVSLQNVPFTFYFLGGLLRFANLTMPALSTSITGEDLSSSAPS